MPSVEAGNEKQPAAVDWLLLVVTLPEGESLTRSGFEYILRNHVRTAKQHCPSLAMKRVHPHLLRHTCALTLLQATKDRRKVALWLGHAKTQTTEMYTRVDPSVKLEALESVVPPKLRSGRFKATDKLIASLRAATLMPTKKPSK
jgi:integrase/recombinase XerD